MSEPSLAASSKKSGQDLIVGLCGFVTSLVTAVILWWVEARFGFAFYSWTFWFVIPVGALLSGCAGASGYLAGSWFFGHRPTRLLLLNIVVASLATFILVHYLSYATLQVEGKEVSDYIPFWQYLDIAIRSTSMEFRLRTVSVGATGELGSFGYLIALLQIGGFAAGGFAVYGHLSSLPYCDKCLRYLSAKGRQIRYTGDADGLKASTARTLEFLGSGAVTSAVAEQVLATSGGDGAAVAPPKSNVCRWGMGGGSPIFSTPITASGWARGRWRWGWQRGRLISRSTSCGSASSSGGRSGSSRGCSGCWPTWRRNWPPHA